MKRFGLATIGVLAFAQGAAAQSFDCSSAVRSDERAICDSRALMRLDDELSDVFEDALSDASPSARRRLRADQSDWLAIRGACRGRKGCIRGVYRDRILELENFRKTARIRIPGSDRDRVDDLSVDKDRWAALGSVGVSRFSERLEIPVGFSRGRFDSLMLRARDGGVKIRRLTIVYGNGERQRIRFRRRFKSGQHSTRVELRGGARGRFIDRIVIRARGSLREDRGATRIEVIGRRVERGDVGRGTGDYIENDRFERRRQERNRFDDDRADERSWGERSEDNGRDSERGNDRFDDRDREFDERRDRYGSLDNDADVDEREGDWPREDAPDGDRDGEQDTGRNERGNRDVEPDHDVGRDRRAELDRGGERDTDLYSRRDAVPEEQTDRNDEADRGDNVPSHQSLRTKLVEFVTDEFHRTGGMSPVELRRIYSDRVDYYGVPGKGVEAVIADKQAYGERWPERAFRIKAGTFKIAETDDLDVFDISYRYDFHVRGESREQKGEGETSLRIDISGGRFVILREDGKVLKRF
jgi:uncharacterized protein